MNQFYKVTTEFWANQNVIPVGTLFKFGPLKNFYGAAEDCAGWGYDLIDFNGKVLAFYFREKSIEEMLMDNIIATTFESEEEIII